MLRVLSLFSGIGAFEKALKNIGKDFELVNYCEIDKYASKTYSQIHNVSEDLNLWDITKIDTSKLHDIDLITYGFPCQDISIAGHQKGFIDDNCNRTRSGLFFEALRIIKDMQPKFAIAENVKALTSKKFKSEFDIVLNSLHDAGYNNYYQVLNAKDYGIPQNRERLWIFAYLGELPKRFNMVPDVIPEEERPRLSAFLDKTPLEEVYLKPSQVEHFIDVHTKHGFKEWIVNEPLCFDVYNHKMKKNAITNTLTEPSHNITRIVEPPLEDGTIRVRKLSIYEQFRLMGFEDGEIVFPDDLNYSQISARAGNGWDVHLVGLLLKHIFDQL